MSDAVKLYTPELLALTLRLADYPAAPELPFSGEARSPSCGSSLRLQLGCDESGHIERLGVRAHACAIGQAAAAIFADGARGRDRAAIDAAERSLKAWLAGDGPQPDWSGLEALSPARAYPARHGAIMLAWQAALRALPNVPPRS